MQTDKILQHYKDNFDKNLPTDKLLDWESRDAQFARFNILAEFIKSNNVSEPTLIDVGCGTADLFDYLKSRSIKCCYVGVDILNQMIDVARKLHEDLDLRCENVFNSDKYQDSFDIVYSSGIFNIDLDNNYEFLTNAVNRFCQIAKKYVIFNLLADTSLDKESGYFYFNREQVDAILKNLGLSNYKIITGYLHNDMSVIIRK